MLDYAKVTTGSRVLDVGAGAGDSTLMAARRVGPTGHVLATDISESMLESAAESARHAGLGNVTTRVANAERLDLEAESFDAAVSRFCLMLIPDYQRALTEIRRVLKPGAAFAAMVYSTPERDPYLSIPQAIAFRVGRLTLPTPEQFGEFRLGAPGVLEEAYRKAGFREAAVHPVSTQRHFPSLADAMQYMKGPLPLRELMVRLTDAEQSQVWAESERALARFVGPNGYESTCTLLIGAGVK